MEYTVQTLEQAVVVMNNRWGEKVEWSLELHPDGNGDYRLMCRYKNDPVYFYTQSVSVWMTAEHLEKTINTILGVLDAYER